MTELVEVMRQCWWKGVERGGIFGERVVTELVEERRRSWWIDGDRVGGSDATVSVGGC